MKVDPLANFGGLQQASMDFDLHNRKGKEGRESNKAQADSIGLQRTSTDFNRLQQTSMDFDLHT